MNPIRTGGFNTMKNYKIAGAGTRAREIIRITHKNLDLSFFEMWAKYNLPKRGWENFSVR